MRIINRVFKPSVARAQQRGTARARAHVHMPPELTSQAIRIYEFRDVVEWNHWHRLRRLAQTRSRGAAAMKLVAKVAVGMDSAAAAAIPSSL